MVVEQIEVVYQSMATYLYRRIQPISPRRVFPLSLLWCKIKLTWYISHCVTAAIIDFCMYVAARWRMIGDSCLEKKWNADWIDWEEIYVIATINFDDNFTTDDSHESVTVHRYCWRRQRMKNVYSMKKGEIFRTDYQLTRPTRFSKT